MSGKSRNKAVWAICASGLSIVACFILVAVFKAREAIKPREALPPAPAAAPAPEHGPWKSYRQAPESSSSSGPKLGPAVDYGPLNPATTPAPSPLASPSSVQPTKESQEWLQRGIQAYEAKNYTEALEALTTSIEISPSFEAYYYRGSAHLYTRNYSDAINDSSKAIDINPTEELSYMIRGSAYLLIGNEERGYADVKIAASLGNVDAQQWLRARGLW